tara:strand:+ start:213 stop:605 length:393 start_codon:yes stop_codon:yes gene_type:complete
MPLVKPFQPGETSEISYKSEVKPLILNTPLSPIELANQKVAEIQQEQLLILNEEHGMKPQAAGNKMKTYKIINTKWNPGIIKACCSSKAVLKAFQLFRNNNIRKRKLTIQHIATNRKYKYSFTKKGLRRE